MQVQPLPAAYNQNDLVSYFVSDHFEWIQNNGGTQWQHFILPKIYPFSQDAIDVNKQLVTTYMPYLNSMRNCYLDGTLPDISAYYSSFAVHNGVLSVVMQEDTPIDLTLYEVYNFDLETGKLIDLSALLSKLGLSREQYLKIAEETGKAVYIQKYGYLEPGTYEFYDQQYAATFTEENLMNAKLYFNPNGNLVMVLDMKPIAGASRYPTAVVLPIT